ncbi:MAG: hypothetical protein JNM94_10600 [Phycisphaerae bacterium]|nr:hypothetical protein [Phycisphaerae bacterium]
MNLFITIVGLVASAAATVAAAGACDCPTDLNADGVTNGADMGILLGAWGTPGGASGADINDDGTVDGADLSTVLGAWGPCAAPENDDCADAIVVGLAPTTVDAIPFCNAYATTSPVPTSFGCNGEPFTIGADLWYRFTAPATGLVTFMACGFNQDFSIAVYSSVIDGLCPCPTGGIGLASLVGCDPDGCLAKAQLWAEAGDCFVIRVGGAVTNGEPHRGSGALYINLFEEGDRCDLAHELPSTSPVTVVGTNAGDTFYNFASPCDSAQGAGIDDEWYRYEMPCDGFLTVTTCNDETDYDTTLAVYSSCDISQQIACNDDSTVPGCQLNGLNRKSRLTIAASSGEVLYIRVAGYQGATGTFALTLDADCVE